MVMEVSRIQPLNPPQAPVTSTSQFVVESPSNYEAPALPIDITSLVESVVHLSQISVLSLVPMLPNWVREDYTFDTVDVFPVFQVSQNDTQYLPATSPVTPPASEMVPFVTDPTGYRLSASGSDWVVRFCPGLSVPD